MTRHELNRFTCTKEEPWSEEKGPSFHPDSIAVSEPDDVAFSANNKTGYECPNCGLRFRVTEPDY